MHYKTSSMPHPHLLSLCHFRTDTEALFQNLPLPKEKVSPCCSFPIASRKNPLQGSRPFLTNLEDLAAGVNYSLWQDPCAKYWKTELECIGGHDNICLGEWSAQVAWRECGLLLPESPLKGDHCGLWGCFSLWAAVKAHLSLLLASQEYTGIHIFINSFQSLQYFAKLENTLKELYCLSLTSGRHSL